MHICRGAYDRADHDCWCSLGRDHSEAAHTANMEAAQARREADEAASIGALREASALLRYIGRKDLAAAIDEVRA